MVPLRVDTRLREAAGSRGEEERSRSAQAAGERPRLFLFLSRSVRAERKGRAARDKRNRQQRENVMCENVTHGPKIPASSHHAKHPAGGSVEARSDTR